ncbi:MAG: permease [Candidatus Izemoplasma sp.]|nr:permease [Candidatus Izemoplasma sp.]
MVKLLKQNKFLTLGIVLLIILSIIDIRLTYTALENTVFQITTMLLIIPPIFIIIGLFDVWVPRETIIEHMGEESKAKGMVLAFFLGAFSAGPTLVAFPIAHLMLKKGAKYSNVIFFLMVWSSLKLPIIFFQITAIGYYLPAIINITMLIVFIISSLLTDIFFTKKDKELYYEKANKSE